MYYFKLTRLLKGFFFWGGVLWGYDLINITQVGLKLVILPLHSGIIGVHYYAWQEF